MTHSTHPLGFAIPAPVGRAEELSLVAACRRGDRAALDRLYRLHVSRVYSVVARMVGDQDADEVVQEVFLKVFRGIPRFRGEARVGTWIYRLAVNASLSFLSKLARRQARVRSVGALGEAPDRPPVSGGALDRIGLERALAALPTGYRAVIILHDVEGLSHEEIAEIMGWHRGTSKSQLHKARARMRELLRGEEGWR